MSETQAATRAAAVVKSPVLTDLEKIAYDYCLETGAQPGPAMQGDAVLHRLIAESMAAKIRLERVQDKLERHAGWLKQQLAKERVKGKTSVDVDLPPHDA